MLHGVVILGYSKRPSKLKSGSLNLISDAIDEIYVHDDQIGPFSRMIFDNVKIVDKKDVVYSTLGSSWPDSNGKIGGIRVVPKVLQIPVYHKVRITFECIRELILEVDKLIKIAPSERFKPEFKSLIWDIYLTEIEDFKKYIYKSKDIKRNKKLKLLTKNLPRFIWIASAHVNETKLFDLLFDATDIERGNYFLFAIEYHNAFSILMRKIASVTDKFYKPNVANVVRSIFEWFVKTEI